MKTVAFYVSGHGFGHASRDIEIMRALAARQPGVRIVARTGAPSWFFATAGRAQGAGPAPSVTVEAVETDPGVVQIDSLQIDEAATARRAAAFHRDFAGRIAAEAAVLAGHAADLVVGDVPALAFAAADRAGRPAVLVGNFTWDWIYSGFPEFDAVAPGVIENIRSAYASASLTLRLPFHGGLAPTAGETVDVPLVARRSTLGREEVRRRLAMDDALPVVLASFGRYGVRLPWDDIALINPFRLLVTDREDPDASSGGPPGRLCRLTPRTMQACGLDYQDLVAAADVVVSKPGYGIVSECIANGASLLYTERGRFPEYDVFVREMPRVLRCRRIAVSDFREGRWSDAVQTLMAQPPPPQRLVCDGADVAARLIEASLDH